LFGKPHFSDKLLEAITKDIFREAKGAGSTFPNITSKRLRGWVIPFPCFKRQLQLAEQFGELVQQLNLSTVHLERCKTLKSKLLSNLLGL
jgi:restriction endonuclease S subunit